MPIKTPISYYGGKQKLLTKLIPLIPQHTIYTEAFCGGAALYLAKQPSKIEVINDKNSNVVNFYAQLQNNFDELQSLVNATLHSREQHKEAMLIYNSPMLYTPVKRAWAFWVACTQSYLSSPGAGWTTSKKDKPAAATKIHYAKNNFQQIISDRIHRTTIEHDDALKVIKRYDSPDAFHYIDPPYYNANMGHYGGYTEKDFENLLQTMENTQGKVMLSSYPSDMLSDYAQKNGWKIHLYEKTLDASANKRKKIEAVTLNYEAA